MTHDTLKLQLNELNEIAGLLLRVNIAVFLFGLFISDKAEMGLVMLIFTLLGQAKVLLRDGYFGKSMIDKSVCLKYLMYLLV